MERKKRVLILCTGNSARSQMAEGLLRHEAGERFDVYSAGTKPGHVRDEAITAMSEIGIDISAHRSKSVDEFIGQEFDYVITVCDNANASCPVFPGATTRLHWPFEDPAAVEGSEATRLAAFRAIRDQIHERLMEFLAEEPVRIPVTDVFDLHSVPDRDVRGVVEAYLEEASRIGLRYVRIIHGRGIGVRREMVRGLLARCDFVETYGDAPGEAGGWGATLVTLKPAS
jgi:arsenate reductase